MSIHEFVVLHYLDRMTDGTGLIQHAIYNVPRRDSGYTTDDNARALRLCARLWCEEAGEAMLGRVTKYLSFLEQARCPNGAFHNFMSYQRNWLDAAGTGDCQGQAVRALAEVLASTLPSGHRELARELLDSVLPVLAELRCLRAQAYVIMTWAHLWRGRVKDIELLECIAYAAAQRLAEAFERNRRADWSWFEPCLTYANAVVPHALFLASERWPTDNFLEVAEASFDFLDRVTTNADVFSPIGNCGWHARGGNKSPYDQQPIEAVTMAEAALDAFGMTRDEKHVRTFARANDWFHGRNSLRAVLAEPRTGACCDGLQSQGINRNQGAESTLAYLWMALLHFQNQRTLGVAAADRASGRRPYERLLCK